jgi:hypothetical protein
MITVEQLKENGFEQADWMDNWWYHPLYKTWEHYHYFFPLDDEDNGVITYIKEDDNYHGIRLNIDTIEKLLQFFECLEKVKQE